MAKKKSALPARRPPISPEAQKYLQDVERRRLEALNRISRIPIASLIWGPDPASNSDVGRVRLLLRDRLLQDGHLAQFSEDLIDPQSLYSIQAQQLSHLEAHDIVFSLPDTPGSIAEIHDFAKLPSLSHKIIAFLDRRWNRGYANRSLLEFKSTATCDLVLYDRDKLPDCIIERACDMVRRLQELYYFCGRRF